MINYRLLKIRLQQCITTVHAVTTVGANDEVFIQLFFLFRTQ